MANLCDGLSEPEEAGEELATMKASILEKLSARSLWHACVIYYTLKRNNSRFSNRT